MSDHRFFATAGDFRRWLEKNHSKKTELWVAYYKKATGKPSLTWSESVDQALCYGWIDGIRKSIDDESYKIRFTPRRPKSLWSAVNIEKMERLKDAGLVTEAGLAAYDEASVERSQAYSYERESIELSREFEPTAQTIRNWVAQAARDAGMRRDGLPSEEREELRRLRQENRRLREERAILAKAAAWFARESVPGKSSGS